VKVAAVQHDICWEDPPATFARLAPMIAEAAAGGARAVVLAEMYSTGFSMATDRIAERAGGPSTAFLVDQAARHRVWVCGSLPERGAGTPGGRPANTLVLAGPDGSVHRYAKRHPFSYAGEHARYAPGGGRVTVDVDGLRTSLFVCYDLRFGDDFWALAPVTDCYIVVANWPAARARHWHVLLQARAIENQAYVVGVNRVGEGDGIAYAGDSMIVGPGGEVLAAAPADGTEAVVAADLDPAVVADTRARYPFLADRRVT
jgi:predicted amidohydrolase